MKLTTSPSLLAAAAGFALALAGCGAVHNAQSAFHSSFRDSFRKSFISSCEGGDSSKTKFCTCAEEHIAGKNTDDQLIAMSSDSQKLSEAGADAIKACAPHG